jgi:hypothetical protein
VSSTLEPLSGARTAQPKPNVRLDTTYNAVRPHASLGYKPPAPEVFVPGLSALPAAPPRPAPHGHAGVSASPQLTFQRDHSMQAGQSTTSDLDRPMLIGENTRRRRHTSAELPAPTVPIMDPRLPDAATAPASTACF